MGQQYSHLSSEERILIEKLHCEHHLAWIGNGVLDSSLEDESLFGEFLRAPASTGEVEPLVVGQPHVAAGFSAAGSIARCRARL